MSKVQAQAQNEKLSKNKKKSYRWLSFGFLLVLLALVVYAFLIIQLNKRMTTKYSELYVKVLDLNLERHKTRLIRQKEKESFAQSIAQLRDDISFNTKQLEESYQIPSIHWSLIQAEYLLRLAVAQLEATRDVTSAKALLEQTDQVLQHLNRKKLLPVRRALSLDILSLASLPPIDYDGVYMQLDNLGRLIDDLPLLLRHMEHTSAITKKNVTRKNVYSAHNLRESGWWQKVEYILSNIWRDFISLFSIKVHDDKLKSIVSSPVKKMQLRQMIRLNIEQAKISLLEYRPRIYKNALLQAKTWVNDYFSQKDEKTHFVYVSLGKLAALNLYEKVPDISRALSVLKRYEGSKYEKISPKIKPQMQDKHLEVDK